MNVETLHVVDCGDGRACPAVLHIVDCPSGAWCPALIDADGTLVLVGKVLTPELAESVAGRIGPGESAVILDPALLDMIRGS